MREHAVVLFRPRSLWLLLPSPPFSAYRAGHLHGAAASHLQFVAGGGRGATCVCCFSRDSFPFPALAIATDFFLKALSHFRGFGTLVVLERSTAPRGLACRPVSACSYSLLVHTGLRFWLNAMMPSGRFSPLNSRRTSLMDDWRSMASITLGVAKLSSTTCWRRDAVPSRIPPSIQRRTPP